MAASMRCPYCDLLLTAASDGFYVDAQGTLIYTNTFPGST